MFTKGGWISEVLTFSHVGIQRESSDSVQVPNLEQNTSTET